MKKLNKNIKTGIATGLVLLASSCSGFLDINKDPNNLADSQVTSTYLLPTTQVGTAFLVGNHLNLLQTCWMQHSSGTGTQTQQYDIFNVFPADGEVNTVWTLAYAQVLPDLNAIIRKSTAVEDFQHVGMAQVLKVYIFSLLTDAFGDIPFKEASLGAFVKPKYDTQEAIYAQLLLDIDGAIANLAKSNKLIPAASGDIIFAGNVTNWRRVAKSIKLKLLVQQRNKKQDVAAINALIAENDFIASNNANFNVGFGFAANAFHPLYQYNYISRPLDLGISTRFLDSMRVNNDPRIASYFTYTAFNVSTNTPSYVAIDNGTVAQGPSTRSRWGRYLTNVVQAAPSAATPAPTANTPVRMITKSMVNFWLAEAALTMGVGGAGADVTYFRQALQDQMDDVRTFCAITDPAPFTAYINARVAAYSALTNTEAKLNLLIREKWISLAGNAFESYNDFRRTGYPRLALPQNPTLAQFPSSYPYPQDEINNNSDNVPANAQNLLDKVWWAK